MQPGLWRDDARCAAGDHRQCLADDCPHAAHWHPLVLRAAEVARTATGDPCAVLCIACPPDAATGLPRVIGTARTAWRGTGIRNDHAAHGPHGNLYDDPPHGPENPSYFKGIVYFVERGRIR